MFFHFQKACYATKHSGLTWSAEAHSICAVCICYSEAHVWRSHNRDKVQTLHFEQEDQDFLKKSGIDVQPLSRSEKEAFGV